MQSNDIIKKTRGDLIAICGSPYRDDDDQQGNSASSPDCAIAAIDENTQPISLKINLRFGDMLQYLQICAMYHQYQLARLNTLGGAHHLCNNPQQALMIARQQEALAVRIGSTSLVIRARGFQAINLGILGEKKLGVQWLKELERLSKQLDGGEMVPFLKASRKWLKMQKVTSLMAYPHEKTPIR